MVEESLHIEPKKFRIGRHVECYCGRIYTLKQFRKMDKLCPACKELLKTHGTSYSLGGVQIRYTGPQNEQVPGE